GFHSGTEPTPDPSGTPIVDDEAAIDAVLKSGNPVLGCWQFQANQRKDPHLAGTVVVDFSVEPDGSVRTVTIPRDTFSIRQMKECISNALKGQHFPPPAARMTLERSYTFPPAPAKP